jgi:RNA polymerase sigma-70 factor (ECF subfamily)
MNISIIANSNSDCTHVNLVAMIPYMRAFARSLCQNATQADDLTQDALVKAWSNRASYAPGTNLKAWVFMILRNQFYSDKRRSWRVLHLDPQIAEQTLVAVTNPTAALELDDLRRAMQELSALRREALTLVAVAGLSYGEAAKICGCAEGTIKSRVSRARAELHIILDRGVFKAEQRPPAEAMASIVSEGRRLQLVAA